MSTSAPAEGDIFSRLTPLLVLSLPSVVAIVVDIYISARAEEPIIYLTLEILMFFNGFIFAKIFEKLNGRDLLLCILKSFFILCLVSLLFIVFMEPRIVLHWVFLLLYVLNFAVLPFFTLLGSAFSIALRAIFSGPSARTTEVQETLAVGRAPTTEEARTGVAQEEIASFKRFVLELDRLHAYLAKLEEMRRSGEVSNTVYEMLKVEYEGKINELKKKIDEMAKK